MTRVLIIGDPHVTPDDLEDCEALLNYVYDVQDEEQPYITLFLGDLHHNHALAHVAVTGFWLDKLAMLTQMGKVFIMEGNHDRAAGAGSFLSGHPSAIKPYRHIQNVTVIDRPHWEVDRNLLFVPYTDDEAEFVKAVNGPHDKCGTVFCHQTFLGSRYENGIYARDGFDNAKIPQANVVSGHIHAPQSFGNVWYPGAPRWRTLSDANVERAIWAVDFDAAGRIVDRRAYDTGGVCRKVNQIELKGDALSQVSSVRSQILARPKDRWHVDLHGPAAPAAAAQLKGLGIKLRSFVDQVEQPRVKESAGIDQSFATWCEGFKPKRGTSLGTLGQLAAERLAA